MVLAAFDEFRSRPWKFNARQDIHLALVVPDIRLWQLLKDKAVIVQPPYQDIHVMLHILVDDKNDPYRALDWQVRVALVESGLVTPEDAKITYPDQFTLGWPKKENECST